MRTLINLYIYIQNKITLYVHILLFITTYYIQGRLPTVSKKRNSVVHTLLHVAERKHFTSVRCVNHDT